MVKVSVIVPVYRAERYLEKCIKSIQSQTMKEWELILIDDGSPDRSGEICDRYAADDTRIRVIHKENGGVSIARNLGIQEAKGEFFAFVDSDDYVDCSLLEKSVKLADQTQCDFVIYNIMSVEPDSGRKDVYDQELPENEVLSLRSTPQLLFTNPSPCNKLIRRSFWNDAHMKFPEGRYYEDLAIIPKLCGKAKRIVFLSGSPLYFYVQREGSIMHGQQYEKNYYNRIHAIMDIIDYFKQEQLYDSFRQELEYLTFLNGYFIPSKELVLGDCHSIYLKKYWDFLIQNFPDYESNPYLNQLSRKDKILYILLKHKCYVLMVGMSKLRKAKDMIWQKRLTRRKK